MQLASLTIIIHLPPSPCYKACNHRAEPDVATHPGITASSRQAGPAAAHFGVATATETAGGSASMALTKKRRRESQTAPLIRPAILRDFPPAPRIAPTVPAAWCGANRSALYRPGLRDASRAPDR